MGLRDRLETMELLWTSISRVPEEVGSPPWHREVLDARRDKVERGDASFLTLEQLRERLRERRP